ncbi:hypothetical protein EAW52_11005 [Pseudomonas sp. LTJR-52]|uniref:hypothetical protein n=1 Tax=Pseudomonas sp. LTJR-52 TaxID=2479392 RepID=UPI000EFD68FB|nr:hypothetical protein [Pseudomonas sp. LTJR-52]AYN94449.1 hypothetical protein EAW52_11005 [Pseudomonas sp. LTJR-52]
MSPSRVFQKIIAGTEKATDHETLFHLANTFDVAIALFTETSCITVKEAEEQVRSFREVFAAAKGRINREVH